MAQKATYLEERITRRSFLKQSLGVGFTLVAAQSMGTAMFALQGCARPAYTDLTVTSSLDFNHTHNVTISGADIGSAPSEKTYTPDGATHTHAIALKKADFEAIKNKQTVTVTCTPAGTTPHAHTFDKDGLTRAPYFFSV